VSTSYYWILDQDGRAPTGKIVDQRDRMNPDWHIGKTTVAPLGQPTRFHWAQSPVSVAVVSGQHFAEDCIVDEYGKKFTGGAFADLLFGLTWLTADVGKWFG
jgi:hypothetical protein